MNSRRSLLLAGLLAFFSAARGAESPLRQYATVTVAPAKTSIYVGSVSLSLTPCARNNGTYATSYVAKVFPFFFYNEQGKLWIVFSDDDLHRLERGETVNFTGHAHSDDGEERRVEGRATRIDATGGKIVVRVFVSKRIGLVFNTTYRIAPR
ncbi:MAG: hypothetical protein EXS39_06105 [Opitutaceae bacterium]|nr:hypothetical protein [Opitutaceae bacterium]